MAESAGEKTEKATEHKRREERKKGNVMQSKDVVTAAFILIVFCVLKVTMKLIIATCESSFDYWFGLAGSGMSDGRIDGMPFYSKLMLEIGKVLVICAGPTLIVGVLVTVIATGAQTKFIFSKESLKFKIDKLNPINGIKKMFSLSSAFELAKAILKLVILVVVVYDEIKKRIPEFATLFDLEIASSMMYMLDTIFSIVIKIAAVFVGVAVVDVLFQYFKFEKDMRMTKQEVKEEYKNLEGDPQVKGKRRQIQRQMSMGRMMDAVPESDVIIRNPTHYAIAIKYDKEKNSAPVVLAKGADNLAMKIVGIAEKHDIVMVENKPLARGLYDSVEVGREIPVEFYHAVAEVLSFVYKLQGKLPQ